MKRIIILALLFIHPLMHVANAESITKPCATCHGPNGQSLNPAWPHLAGQQTDYLKKQLLDLQANKTRHVDEAMQPFILNLTDDEMTTLADYYAKQPRPPGSHRLRKKNKLGETIYQFGNPKKQMMPCVTCHGSDAKGNGIPGFPSLRGQQLNYITHQLEAFKTGARNNDPSHTMQRITENMSSEEIYALAHYLASLSR